MALDPVTFKCITLNEASGDWTARRNYDGYEVELGPFGDQRSAITACSQFDFFLFFDSGDAGVDSARKTRRLPVPAVHENESTGTGFSCAPNFISCDKSRAVTTAQPSSAMANRSKKETNGLTQTNNPDIFVDPFFDAHGPRRPMPPAESRLRYARVDRDSQILQKTVSALCFPPRRVLKLPEARADLVQT